VNDFRAHARQATPSRIGQDRRGDGVATHDVLAFSAAHAAARDAIHHPLDVAAVSAQLVSAGWPAPVVVSSAASDRGEYLRRPDLGRRLAAATLSAVAAAGDPCPDLVVVLADGLSADAVEQHAVPLLCSLRDLIPPGAMAPPVIAVRARVALGDEVAAALGAQACLVLIGERPGLSVTDSLGAYLTWDPKPGIQDSARNCVSNIRQPGGLGHAAAATTIAALLAGARELGATGVRLKDTSNGLPGNVTPMVER
jgi:ethanolamine ammonia-lyase small subunit